ncbi:hypothetical protein [Actinomadura rugatobispora]|uniref:Novel STAND NTPase 5 domain-containing protein n=1 Tax=Actinomadura rugatobispora TaxID=1994 RepID=A0ABW0ZVU9_9ACTN|nr:hypothetical protein GCM10010200_051650 [Actinomadura rugatobispora]
MEPAIATLLRRLVEGPTFLLLGQAIDDLVPTVPDPALVGSHAEAAHAAYVDYDRTVMRQPAPQWLADAADYPWNGVFTSRIDSGLYGLFQRDWRRVDPTGQPQLGRHPRSATSLQLRHLFGGLGLPEEERPPTDAVAEVESRARAAEILNALADTIITPRGVLIIDGYRADDWLRPQELFTFATRLQAGQAHLFSATDELLGNPFIRAAQERGVLITHCESFNAVLSALEDSGRFQRLDAGRNARGGRFIPVGDTFAEVDIDTWNRVVVAARPVNTELLEPFTSASSAMRYERFRHFLGSGEGQPQWKAVASGYNLTRDFESKLLHRVQSALDELGLPEPLIVAGQTATGKTIALCALALEVARSGEAAVLHRSVRGERPTLAAIEAFASWADQSHGLPTLLVWDGMVDVDEYYLLQRQLSSRGQRVLIVGSSYLPPPAHKRRSIIRVEPTLNPEEFRRMTQWLSDFDIPIPGNLMEGLDSSFLALLYRLLPETERGLRLGLVQEARAAEIELEKLSMTASNNSEARLTAVARALTEAGFNINDLRPSDRPNAELINLPLEERSAAEQITSMILAVGRRGLRIPLELALRVLGKDGAGKLIDLVKRFDIFRWTEDDTGDQFLGSRTPLEAELLAREDLSIRTEVEVAVQLITNLRPLFDRWGGGEVQFIADLMEKIGPQSDDHRYAPHYLELATAFGELRHSRGQTHPRLSLLEANLTREYVMWAQQNSVLASAERLQLMRDVQRMLEDTLEDADASPQSRLNLLVELASAEGAQIFELTNFDEDATASQVLALMTDVTRAALRARALDPENVYPVDVIAWTTRNAVRSGMLQGHDRLDLLANAQASLASLDPGSLSPSQQAKYDLRNVEIAELLEDPAMETKHLVALSNNNDPVAYYFLALLGARAEGDGPKVAVQVLLQAPPEVRSDWRCSRLLLDLFWESKTGKRFLRGEREIVALTEHDWHECLTIADAIPDAGGYDRYRRDFLRGLSLFHRGQYQSSKAVFRQLDDESRDLSSRVISKYLASNSDGTAALYTGRVISATPDGRRGVAWVNELHIEVPFIPIRFSVSDYRKRGEILPAFHIAFNMRGALADPISRFAGVARRSADAK